MAIRMRVHCRTTKASWKAFRCGVNFLSGFGGKTSLPWMIALDQFLETFLFQIKHELSLSLFLS